MAGCRRGLAIAIALIHVARGVDDAFAKKATLTSIDGYPKPTCMCRTTLDGDLEEVLEAIAPLKLKGIKLRKMLAALETLRGEASAFAPNRVPDFEWRDGQMERPLEAPLDLFSPARRRLWLPARAYVWLAACGGTR